MLNMSMCTSSKQEIEFSKKLLIYIYIYIFMCLCLSSAIRGDYFKSSKLSPQWAEQWNRAH